MYGHLGPLRTMPFQLLVAAWRWKFEPWCLVDLHMEIKKWRHVCLHKNSLNSMWKIMRDTVMNSCDIDHKTTVLEKEYAWKLCWNVAVKHEKNPKYLYNIQRIFMYLRLLINERISTKIKELGIICTMEFISIIETSVADLQDGVSDIFVLNDCLSVCLKGN